MLKTIVNAIKRMLAFPKGKNQIGDILDTNTREIIKRAIRSTIQANIDLVRSEETKYTMIRMIIDAVARTAPIKALGRHEREMVLLLIEDRLIRSNVLKDLSDRAEEELYNRIVKALGL